MFKVMIIDTANTHVSPMAEILLRKKMPDQLKNKIDLCSRGIYAQAGNPCTIEVRETGKDFDRDLYESLKKHEAIPLKSREELENSDCVVVTSKTNLKIMHDTISHDKVLMLADYHSNQEITEIPDPYNKNYDFYREVWHLLDESIDNFIVYLNDRLSD